MPYNPKEDHKGNIYEKLLTVGSVSAGFINGLYGGARKELPVEGLDNLLWWGPSAIRGGVDAVIGGVIGSFLGGKYGASSAKESKEYADHVKNIVNGIPSISRYVTAIQDSGIEEHAESTRQVGLTADSDNSTKLEFLVEEVNHLKKAGHNLGDPKVLQNRYASETKITNAMSVMAIATGNPFATTNSQLRKVVEPAIALGLISQSLEELNKEELSKEEYKKRLIESLGAYMSLVKKYNLVNPKHGSRKIQIALGTEAGMVSGMTLRGSLGFVKGGVQMGIGYVVGYIAGLFLQ